MSKNSKNKKFNSSNKGLTSPPTLHETLPATTQRLFTEGEGFPRRFWAKSAGNIVLKDAEGTSASYPVLASQPFVFENCIEIVDTTDIELIIQW